jgi:prevent-host-death family protein
MESAVSIVLAKAKAHLGQVLARVEVGEALMITRRGITIER